MEYKATLDKLSKGMTIAVFIIVLVVFGTLYIKHKSFTGHVKRLIGVVIIPPILIGTYIYAPKGYTLNDTELRINRVVKG